jgi:Flp pilus assembly protein TadG
MNIVRTALGFHSRLRRFSRDRDGVSAVEFALTLPIMLTLYLGAVEVGDGMAIKFKTTLVARTVTDLASQYVSIDVPTMNSILGASATVVTPYSAATMVVTLSELKIPSGQIQGVVQWSCTLNGTSRTLNSQMTMPANLQNPTADIYILYGEVTYPYTPAMGYVLTGTFNINENIFFYPRLSPSISGPTNASPCS